MFYSFFELFLKSLNVIRQTHVTRETEGVPFLFYATSMAF